jgi:hypothetical protein
MAKITLVGMVVPTSGDVRVTSEDNTRVTPEGNQRVING